MFTCMKQSTLNYVESLPILVEISVIAMKITFSDPPCILKK